MNPPPTKKFSWKSAVVLCLGVGLLAAVLSITLETRIIAAQAYSHEAPIVAPAPTPGGSGGSFEMPTAPARLVIPTIGVDAAVESTGLSWRGTGAMGVPSNFTNVAWYNGGPRPGMPGSAVIDGHLDGKDVPEAVFYNLDKLKVGDTVEVVDKSGATLHFVVTGSKVYAYDTPTTEIFLGDNTKARLNLITCAGDWVKAKGLYDKRIVVFTELVTNS